MDYIIVGGGVYGCGIAWELARRGAAVLLLEAGALAGGASGGLGKRGVRANGRDLRELPLMRMAYEQWPTLHEELGHDTGYARVGHLQIIERPRDLPSASARAWMQQQQGIATQVLDGATLREREPYVNEGVLGALYCPNDGIADHTATTLGYAAAAQRAGAQIRTGTRVTAIEQKAGRVTAVQTATAERIAVGKALILLANSAVPSLLETAFQLTLPIWSRLPQVALTAPVDPQPLRHLIGHAHRRLAMKALPSGQVMISGGWLGRWDERQGKGLAVADQVAGNVAEAVALYPILDGVVIVDAAADRLETESADGIPIIDQVSGIANLYYGTGWSGHGWAIAPAVSRLLATWVFTGQRSPLLAPFAYARFQ
ncbi:MAG: FAD-binding oxidoreductase [Caldilineaceae bacterium]|nr:FAD-binding oxidoreductase [Caldilineaceae bacterium]